MRGRSGQIRLCMVLCFVLFGTLGAHAQVVDYAQTLYAPVLQSTAAGDLGIALSNPGRVPVDVIATARSYTGEIISDSRITNPVVLSLPALGQRAFTASEVFGQGINGQTGWIAFQSPSTAISGLFLLFDGNLTHIDGGELPNAGQTRLVLPKVFAGPGNSSTVTFVNTTSATFDCILSVYDNSGALRVQKVVPLAARAGFSSSADQLGAGTSFTGYATVQSLVNHPTPLVGMVRYINSSDSAVLTGMSGNSGLRSGYISHLVIGGGYSSRLSLVNPQPFDQFVRVTAVLSDGFNTSTSTADRLLTARSRTEEDLTSMFGLFPANQITGYVRLEVLTDTPGISGFMEFGTTDGTLLSAVPAQSGAGYSEYFFSHIAEGLGYYTGLALLNPNDETIPVAIDIIGKDGIRVGGKVINLAGGERRARLMSELIPGTVQLGGYVRVSSTRNIYALELFGSSTSLRFAANVSARGTQVAPLLSIASVTAANGALVVSPDNRVSQLIPPKALPQDSVIQLNYVDSSTFPKPFPDKRLVSAVEALPGGTQFDIPTRLTFPIGLQLAPGTQVPLYLQSPLTQFRFEPSEVVATVDETGRNAVGTISHFSNYGVIWPDDQIITTTGVTPNQALSGAILTIAGSGFVPALSGNIVTFAGPDNTSIAAPVISATDSSLQVVVPQGAVSGSIFVRIGTKSSQGLAFTSLNPNPIPTISSAAPSSVNAGAAFTSVLITGTGFNASSLGILNGQPFPTLYLGPTSLRIELTGPLTSGAFEIGVRNPGSQGGRTATIPFDVFP